ncbi:MAG: hypothetical protein OXQ89_23960 [Rhodospirillaceae bacterium]|nr:hypothetical protein [Rhodospirillaceae bacterium]MDE0000803.1 hypothetical protein [Rhodospirillaceae bacterium]
MMIRPLRSTVLLACLAATPIWAQLGHPAKGAWSGFWGPSESEQRRVLLLLEWADNEITGVINPGRNGVRIDRTELDASTWTLTIEAEMPVEDGGTARYVATGKIENLGSWTNRRYSGKYTHGNESGTFLVILN